MNAKETFALVPRPTDALEKAEPGKRRILSSMVGDALALAGRKFRIGEIELHEPDYRQLMAWAEQVKLPPREVLRRLKAGLRWKGRETRIENGKFVKLNWDAGILPISEFKIQFPLTITDLSFAPIHQIDEGGFDLQEELDGVPPEKELPQGYAASNRILKISTVSLPKLKFLDCSDIGLETLSVERADALECLICAIEKLDLRPFPNLRELRCLDQRAITGLDLIGASNLVELDCQSNLIKNLDLSPVPKLRKLNCSDNDMRELILPSLPELVELECENSSWDKDAGLGRYLEKIDLRGAPNLERLDCSCNMLEKLDLSCVAKLKHLDSSRNPLAELDLSCVLSLETLKCKGYRPLLRGTPWLSDFINWDPPFIKVLDIRSLPKLKELNCDPRTRIIQRPDQHFIGDMK